LHSSCESRTGPDGHGPLICCQRLVCLAKATETFVTGDFTLTADGAAAMVSQRLCHANRWKLQRAILPKVAPWSGVGPCETKEMLNARDAHGIRRVPGSQHSPRPCACSIPFSEAQRRVFLAKRPAKFNLDLEDRRTSRPPALRESAKTSGLPPAIEPIVLRTCAGRTSALPAQLLILAMDRFIETPRFSSPADNRTLSAEVGRFRTA